MAIYYTLKVRSSSHKFKLTDTIFFIVDKKEIKFMETIGNDVETARIMGYFLEYDWKEARKYLINFLNNYDSYNLLKMNKAELILLKKGITEFEKVLFIFNSMF